MLNEVALEAWLTLDSCYLIGWKQKSPRILHRIELLKIVFDTGKLCSKFGEDLSMNDVTILSTDTGHVTR